MSVIQLIDSCQDKINSLQEMIPIKQYKIRIEEIDYTVNNSNIWGDPKKAAALMKERQKLSDLLNKYQFYQEQISFYQECISSLPDDLENSISDISNMYQEMCSLEFKQMMKDPMDDSPAILSINAGAGGLEAANWCTMILRMYSKWADSKGFKIEMMDFDASEEYSSICTDSVSIRITGPYAYGFLKGEIGVHRLIRNSPFNSSDARHTSFASVDVVPDVEDKIDIKIEDKDVEVTAIRGSGSGGQNVNKVSSCIRIRHIPTGIQIVSRSERDQLQNKLNAFSRLKAKLYQLELDKKNAEQDKKIAQQSAINFGSQIRTYTLTPYQLVKDHRSDYEINDSQSVLDGNLDSFLFSNLKTR